MSRTAHATAPVAAASTALWEGVFLLFLLYGTFGIDWLPGGLGRLAPVVEVGLLGLAVAAAPWRRAGELGRATWLVGVLLAWLLVTALWSPLPEVTVTRAGRLVIHFATAACLVAALPSIHAAFRLVALALGLGVLLNLLAVAVVPGTAITDIGVRGFMASKNNAGQVAMVAAIAAATLALAEEERRWRRVGAGLLLLALALLVVSRSKTSMGAVGLVAVLVPPLFVAARRGSLALGVLAGSGLALVAGAVLVVGLMGWSWADVALLLIGDTTVSARDGIWAVIWATFLEHWAGGFGFGAYWDVDGMVSWIARPIFFGDEGGVINQGHNGYLDLAMQAGLPGLALGLAIVAGAGALALRWMMRTPDRYAAVLAAGLFAVVLAFAVNNVTESTLFRQSGHFLHGVFIVTLVLAARGGRHA